MEKTTKATNTDLINIKSLTVQAHIGASKYINDDWGTIAFSIPRDQLQSKFADPELRYNCIYFLFGYDQTTEKIYVGQAKKRNNGESVLARLHEHDSSTTEKYCDIWKWAVVCTGKEDTWSSDDLNALEHVFYNEIPVESSLNGNNPNSGGADYNDYTDKIRQIKNYITTIGFSIFADNADTEKIRVTSTVNKNTKVEDLQNGLARITEIVTPHKVVKAMCDMLPDEVWNDQTVFLDPACKGGEYLREIYDRLMDSELLQAKYPDEFERSNHILGKQLYGIALSQTSLERTTKKLRGYEHNIRVIPNYIHRLKGIGLGIKSDGTLKTIKDILNEEFNKDMKIDVIIGNPPYQEATQSIYPYFIDLATALKPDIINMIVRNNWLTSDTMKDTRNKLINFGLKDVINYSVVREVFPNIGVAVSIFNAQKEFTGPTHIAEIKKGEVVNDFSTMLHGAPAIFMNNLECSIANKVNSLHEESFRQEVYPQEAFRITSVMGTGRGEGSYTLDFETKRSEEFNVGVLCKENGIQYYNWVRADDVPNRTELINQYKVVACGRYNYNENPITSITGLGLGTVCSSTFAPLYASEDKIKAYGAYTYIRTKFFRFLVRLLCTSGITNHSEAKFELVPMQDFTKTWTDEELYKKYNLTQEEIDYIEKTIKPLN